MSEVTQEDREWAAKFDFSKGILEGKYDDGWAVPKIAAHRKLVELRAARLEAEQIVRWLHDADDQAADDLCGKVLEECQRVRQTNEFVAQRFFDLFAAVIEAGSYKGEGSS